MDFLQTSLGGLLAVVIVALIMSLRSGRSKVKKIPDVRPPLTGDRQQIDEDSEDVFDFDNEVASSSKKSSVNDPFLTDD